MEEVLIKAVGVAPASQPFRIGKAQVRPQANNSAVDPPQLCYHGQTAGVRVIPRFSLYQADRFLQTKHIDVKASCSVSPVLSS